MNALFDSAGLALIYLVLLGLGILYAVLVLVGGGLQGVEGPGADVDLGGAEAPAGVEGGSGEFKLPALSPVTIASFVSAFGAFGLIGLNLFNASGQASLLWALLGGAGVGAAAHAAFSYFLIKPQGSSEVRLRDMLGAVAEVTVPIPADSVGEVAYVAQGGRQTLTARSASGAPIARGTAVLIEKVVGGVAVVRPQA